MYTCLHTDQYTYMLISLYYMYLVFGRAEVPLGVSWSDGVSPSLSPSPPSSRLFPYQCQRSAVSSEVSVGTIGALPRPPSKDPNSSVKFSIVAAGDVEGTRSVVVVVSLERNYCVFATGKIGWPF